MILLAFDACVNCRRLLPIHLLRVLVVVLDSFCFLLLKKVGRISGAPSMKVCKYYHKIFLEQTSVMWSWVSVVLLLAACSCHALYSPKSDVVTVFDENKFKTEVLKHPGVAFVEV